jgi:hypothetical protein
MCLKDEQGYMACTQPCDSDAQCTRPGGYTGVCRTFGSNGKLCASHCSTPKGWTCIDDTPVKCSVAGEKACLDCGCPDGDYCAVDHCVPKGKLSDACEYDSECLSGNCSPGPGFLGRECLAKFAGACTNQNCDICINGNFCTRHCDGPYPYECPGNSQCLHSLTVATGQCELLCDGRQGPDQATCDPYGFSCVATSDSIPLWYCETP